MSNVTHILSQIEEGDPQAAQKLLPLVYDELRKLASAKLAQEKPGQTLQATALVHEAYLRLVNVDYAQRWNSRGHFFTAAAECMRRILVDQARRKVRPKHGGPLQRIELDEVVSLSEDRASEVYMAEQTAPVKRRVALKIIKPGMDTRQVVARFEAERQALSLMHPTATP